MATTPRSIRLICLSLAAVAVAALLPLTGAAAAPTSRDARRELDALNREVDRTVEDYDEARLALAAANRRVAAASARVARIESQLHAASRGLGDLAAAAYIYGGQDEIVQLLTTSTPQTFLQRAGTIDHIARNRTNRLRTLKVLQRKLRTEREAAASVALRQRDVERSLAATRARIARQVARQQALLSRLESAESRARRLEAARRTARASRSRITPVYSGPASGRAMIAVREAYRQLGKPYRWGASGPDSFDCSGLTMWVWGKAGVSLPHSSRAQYGSGVHVSRSQLRPGDLVFYGSPIHHVGIYVGNGQYIAAPQTGDVVSFRKVDRPDYTGAVRL